MANSLYLLEGVEIGLVLFGVVFNIFMYVLENVKSN